jgi:hypothetical protein
MRNPKRSFSAANIASIESMITAALEKGARLGDVVKGAGQDPVVTEGKKGFDISDRDIRVLAEITSLYQKLEWAPTLQELIEVRGKMLRQRKLSSSK